MYPGMRVEFHVWELQRRLRRERMENLWDDPNYRMQRQQQLDTGRMIGQIFLSIGVLVGISYFFFP